MRAESKSFKDIPDDEVIHSYAVEFSKKNISVNDLKMAFHNYLTTDKYSKTWPTFFRLAECLPKKISTGGNKFCENCGGDGTILAMRVKPKKFRDENNREFSSEIGLGIWHGFICPECNNQMNKEYPRWDGSYYSFERDPSLAHRKLQSYFDSKTEKR